MDNSNNIYVGYSYVWNKSLTGTSWVTSMANQPPSAGYLNSEPNVSDFVIAEPYKDTVYIAYDEDDQSQPMDSPINERLWLSFNAFSTDPSHPATWRNITPPEVQYWPIQTIAIDPQNAGRIWVGLSS